MQGYDVTTFKDLITFVAGMLVVIAAVIAFGMWLTNITGERSCYARWGDFKAQWDYWAGCRVEIDGKLIPEDRIRKDRP